MLFWHMMIAGQSSDLKGLLLSALPWRYLSLAIEAYHIFCELAVL